MSMIQLMRRQKAVYWKAGPLDTYGRYTYPFDPIEIVVRWDAQLTTLIGKDGSNIMTTSLVYVDRDMAEGDYLMLGPLVTEESFDSSGIYFGSSFNHVSFDSAGTPSLTLTDPIPQKNVGAWEVKKFTKAPDFNNLEFLRKVYL